MKPAMTKTKKRGIASLVTLVVVLAVYFIFRGLINAGMFNTYYLSILNLACINIIAAVSLNLVTGLMGQLVLGHAGFMLVGAYASALFTKNAGLSLAVAFPISLIIAGLLAAIFGFLIGIPALRLRGDYLAIITLGFGEIIRVFANNLAFTNGAKGLSGIPSLSTRQNPAGMFSYVFLLAAFVIAISYTFGTSRQGRSVIAIREDEIAAEASGVNPTYYKLLTFTISAFFAGVAGALYAHHLGVIDPSRYDFNRSVELLMMVVLGGMGSITGSVIAATVLTALPEMLRSFAAWRMLIYSITLVVVMLFRPKGLLGRKEIHVIAPFEKLRAWWLKRRRQKTPQGGGGE